MRRTERAPHLGADGAGAVRRGTGRGADACSRRLEREPGRDPAVSGDRPGRCTGMRRPVASGADARFAQRRGGRQARGASTVWRSASARGAR